MQVIHKGALAGTGVADNGYCGPIFRAFRLLTAHCHALAQHNERIVQGQL
jgi:hypothetical protein